MKTNLKKSVVKGKPALMAAARGKKNATVAPTEEQSAIDTAAMADEIAGEVEGDEAEEGEEAESDAEGDESPEAAELLAKLKEMGYVARKAKAKKKGTQHLVKVNENYFPAEGSKLRVELDKIAAAGKKGLPASEFKGAMPQLSQLTVNSLVNMTDGKLFVTQRCLDIVAGKITLENPRGDSDGFWTTVKKAAIARKTSPEVVELLSQLKDLVEDVELPKKSKDEGEESAA